jgi:hypothetical protein
MKNKNVIFILLFLSVFSCAQAYRIIDNNGNADAGYSVLPSADGGCVIAGYSYTVGTSMLAMAARLYPDGGVEWIKQYSGSVPDQPYDKFVTSIIPSSGSDNGFMMTGIIFSMTWVEGYMMFLDPDFNFKTSYFAGGIGTGDFYTKSAAPAPGNNYIIAGFTDSTGPGFGAGGWDMYYSRRTYDGGVVWEKTFGWAGNEYANFVTPTASGGYLLAGRTNSMGAGGYDALVALIDANGNTTAWFTAGGTGDDAATSAYEDGAGYIIAGYTTSAGAGGRDMYLAKADASGNTLWFKTYGGPYNDNCYYMQKTAAGGYVLVGGSDSAATTTDAYIVMTDSSGNMLWQKTFSSPYPASGSNPFLGVDNLYSLCATADGNYIAVGTNNEDPGGVPDVFAVKFDSSGNDLWTSVIYRAPDASDEAYVCPEPVNSNMNFVFSLDGDADVTINIFTMNGKNAGKIYAQGHNTNRNTVYFNASSLPPGVYLYTIKAKMRSGKTVSFKPGKFAVER